MTFPFTQAKKLLLCGEVFSLNKVKIVGIDKIALFSYTEALLLFYIYLCLSAFLVLSREDTVAH